MHDPQLDTTVINVVREAHRFDGLSILEIERKLTVFLRDNGISEEQLNACVQDMLNSETLYLNSLNGVATENRFAPYVLQRVKHCLDVVEKPELLDRFLHAIRLTEENGYILREHICPAVEDWCVGLDAMGESAAYPMDNEVHQALTMYQKAFHFNFRMCVDEIVRILRVLPFLLRDPDRENRDAPNTSFSEFYDQIHNGTLDYFDDRILRAIKESATDMAFQRAVRNSLKDGAVPRYSRVLEGGSKFVQCRVRLKKIDRITADLMRQIGKEGNGSLTIKVPQLLGRIVDLQKCVIGAIMETLCDRTRHTWNTAKDG